MPSSFYNFCMPKININNLIDLKKNGFLLNIEARAHSNRDIKIMKKKTKILCMGVRLFGNIFKNLKIP